MCILGTAHDLCALKSCVDVTLGCAFIDFTHLIQSKTAQSTKVASTWYKRTKELPIKSLRCHFTILKENNESQTNVFFVHL